MIGIRLSYWEMTKGGSTVPWVGYVYMFRQDLWKVYGSPGGIPQDFGKGWVQVTGVLKRCACART